MKLILIPLIAGVKTLLTKGFALVFFLLLIFLKGKELRRETDRWNAYLLQLPEEQVLRLTASIYTASALLSSLISYALFAWLKFKRPLFLALAVFLLGLFFTWRRYTREGRAAILEGLWKIKQFNQESPQENP